MILDGLTLKEAKDIIKDNKQPMENEKLNKACDWLEEHLFTITSVDDVTYGENYIASDFNTTYDLISAFRKAMEE